MNGVVVDVAANGIAINSMCVSDGYCVTGSDDGYVRLWPLDFQHVFIEAGQLIPVFTDILKNFNFKEFFGF